MEHYTLSQRFSDHTAVIDDLISNPPKGWNGKFIFVSVSEGGPLATRLTETYQAKTLATMNWAGGSGIAWKQELWLFLNQLYYEIFEQGPWPICWGKFLPRWLLAPFDLYLPHSWDDYSELIDQTLLNPTTEKTLWGMTYKYHADVLSWPAVDYAHINMPYLLVSGTKDPALDSNDVFAEKALEHGIDITYLRIEDMDHFIRKRPDVTKQSFDWLEAVIAQDANDS